MKRVPVLFAVSVIGATLAFVYPLVAQQARISPHETISTRVGGKTLVTVTYGRPYSKDPKGGAIRKVWGTLVPWDKAWRAGSDEATSLITPEPLDFNGTTIPAGAYTLYMVPSEKNPTKLAFSKKIGYWGIPVDEKQDLVRVDMTKSNLDKELDQFTISLDKGDNNGAILKMAWENTAYSVPFSVKK